MQNMVVLSVWSIVRREVARMGGISCRVEVNHKYMKGLIK